jgi:hypothetical protein
VSQKIRKRIEEGFGWGKAIGLIRQIKVRGLWLGCILADSLVVGVCFAAHTLSPWASLFNPFKSYGWG